MGIFVAIGYATALAVPLVILIWHGLAEPVALSGTGGNRQEGGCGCRWVENAKVESVGHDTDRPSQFPGHNSGHIERVRVDVMALDALGTDGNPSSQHSTGRPLHSGQPYCDAQMPEAQGIDWNRLMPRSCDPPLPSQRDIGGFLDWLLEQGLGGPVDYPRLSALQFEYCLVAEVEPLSKIALRRALESAGCRRRIRDITKHDRRNKVVTYEIPTADVTQWAA